MYKNGKFIPCLLWDSHFLSGCDYFADKHLVEELKNNKKNKKQR